jgi:two-component system response regulator AtoC
MGQSSMRCALLVDSVKDQGVAIKELLEKLNFDIDYVSEHSRAFELLATRTYDLAIVEMTGGKTCDLELLQYITRNRIMTATIAIASNANSGLGPRALEKGAHSFLVKPMSLDQLDQYARQAIQNQKHAEDAERLARKRQQERRDRRIIGSSAAIRSVLDLIASLAESTYTTVLIKGESGTGKELVASAIHDATFQDSGPFNGVNCAAIPAELMEAELFGHEKGAFTGAYQAKRGIIELTEGGTLFLDEIGELPMALQPKLLRFLDEKSYRRVGGVTDIKVSLRVIAATNRNIEKMVEAGEFRRDLYFRLSGFPITLPPLRQRERDVIELANDFIDMFTRRYGKKLCGLSTEMERMFLTYPWPGNIRELRNIVERAAIISSGDRLDVGYEYFEQCFQPLGAPQKTVVDDIALPLGRPFFTEIAYYEKELIELAISQSGGVKSNAARLLGISRYAFERLTRRVEKLTSEGLLS